MTGPNRDADGTTETDEASADGATAADESADQRLGVVVPKPDAEVAIESLRTEGVYDDRRSVRERDDETVVVPVTDPPESTDVLEVVELPGDPRLRTLADHLRERDWTDAELETAPASWAVVGSVVLVDAGDAVRPTEVGEALLDLHGEADTVLARGPITGDHRRPDVEVIAGEGDTETVHVEHGTKYALDLATVMFSPGNKTERARMGEAVSDGERVLDMFAGVGYFTLPMARAGAAVTAVERNPEAFRYLLENAQLNDVTDRIRPYRADCRDVAGELSVERVVMGYYDAYEYLDSALAALESGGVVHMHEATPEALVFDRPIERLREAAADRDRSVTVVDTRRVKGYSEGVAHVVVDARVE